MRPPEVHETDRPARSKDIAGVGATQLILGLKSPVPADVFHCDAALLQDAANEESAVTV